MMEFQVLSRSETRLELSAELAVDSPVFKGHFPFLPVVPGVLQVNWAMDHSGHWYPQEGFCRLDKLKFQQVMIPGDNIILVLEHIGGGKVTFEYRFFDEGVEVSLSSGCLVFRV